MGGGRRYCVLCSHHQGQVTENNEKITLHKIPAGTKESDKMRRESWIQRIRFIRPNAPITENTILEYAI
jgi:tRNA(Ile)-lysidine synthase TilS/MesJ